MAISTISSKIQELMIMILVSTKKILNPIGKNALTKNCVEFDPVL